MKYLYCDVLSRHIDQPYYAVVANCQNKIKEKIALVVWASAKYYANKIGSGSHPTCLCQVCTVITNISL